MIINRKEDKKEEGAREDKNQKVHNEKLIEIREERKRVNKRHEQL